MSNQLAPCPAVPSLFEVVDEGPRPGAAAGETGEDWTARTEAVTGSPS